MMLTRLNSHYLVGVESPVLELLLEKRTTHVERVVQLAGAVVVEDLREDARMSVEEVLVEDGVVVGERLGQPRQARRRDLLERRLVRLVADAAHVDRDAIVDVRHVTVPYPLGSLRRRHDPAIGDHTHADRQTFPTSFTLFSLFSQLRRAVHFPGRGCNAEICKLAII